VARIIASEMVTTDMVIEDPGGGGGFEHGGWILQFDQGEDGRQIKLEEIFFAEALLMGRVTYERLASYWPEAVDDSGFAQKINSMPKYVVSSTLADPEWENTTVLSGDAVAAVRELKESASGPILLNGSAQLAQALTEAGLVDEFRAMVHPVLVAEGLRMFPDPAEMQKLKLKQATAYDSGVALLIYERAEG
jgi:dihydrofolate reductase